MNNPVSAHGQLFLLLTEAWFYLVITDTRDRDYVRKQKNSINSNSSSNSNDKHLTHAWSSLSTILIVKGLESIIITGKIGPQAFGSFSVYFDHLTEDQCLEKQSIYEYTAVETQS